MGTDVVGDGLYWVGASHDVFAHGWNLLVCCVKLQRIVLTYPFFLLLCRFECPLTLAATL